LRPASTCAANSPNHLPYNDVAAASSLFQPCENATRSVRRRAGRFDHVVHCLWVDVAVLSKTKRAGICAVMVWVMSVSISVVINDCRARSKSTRPAPSKEWSRPKTSPKTRRSA